MSADSFEAPSFELLAELLPAYDFEAFIAQGGMGAVYKARQRSLDRDVAIKILPRELGEDPEFRQSFEVEAKAMARLNHPNLIGVYDYGDVDGMPYIVMEFVNGKSLFHSAYNMQVDPIQAVGIVKGICDGLAHAHENGVIHRDIKPANILLNEKVVPKIGDFGLARPSDEDGSGLIMGTPGYVAPEVFHHPEKADRRSDLFALGVVLYELLIGRCPPFNNYQPPASTVCGCDVALDRICDKAMHPVASMRYQTAEEFSAALDAWLRKASAPAAAQPVAGRAGGPRRPPRAAPSYQGSGSRDSSSGAIKGLLMLAAAIVVVAIGWSKFSSAQNEATPKGLGGGKDGTAVVSPAETKRPNPDRDKDKGLPDAKDTAAAVAAPLESLAKLKAALVSGKRDAMPEGSVKLGETHFMVIPTPMTWTAAQAFAAKHGAHLFVAESDKALQQVASLMPAPAEAGAEAGLWIGAGTVAGQSWSWVDGSSWHLDTQPEGKGAYLILDAKGGLQARETADRYPFVIQWQADGTNPSTLALVLARAGKSIEAGTPVLPPGTIEYDGRLIYFAYSTSSFAKAIEFCTEAKGHLMLLDSEEKAKWLAEHLPAEDIKDGLWAGGYRQDEKWIWLTGEPFGYTRWQDEAQPSNHGGLLKVIPGGDWLSAYAGDPASGFIVEWDISPGGGDGGAGHADAAAPPVVAELEAKAKELLENLNKDRDKELAANAKAFAWDLDGWHKDLSKNEQSSWNRDVAMFKALVKGNRVPAVVDASSGIRLSQRMSKINEFSLTKQKAIDATFESKADKIRASYATRMGELAKKLAADGDAKGAKAAESRATKAAALKTWLPTMLEGVEEVMNAAASDATAKPGVPGRWVWLSTEIVTVRPDGTAFNDTQKVEGTWKPKGFGGTNYEFSWDDGKWIDQVSVNESGMKISGSNQKGDNIFAWKIVQGSDPIVDAWVWTPAICIFCDDHTVHKGKDTGTWALVSNEGGERSYSVKWQSGFVDNVTLAKDPDTFKGTNNKGNKVSGKRVPRS